MDWLGYVKLFASLLPLIMDLIKQVEAMLPQSGAGPQKLQLVLDTLQATSNLADKAQDEFAKMKPALTAIINSAVSVFNTLKVFKQ